MATLGQSQVQEAARSGWFQALLYPSATRSDSPRSFSFVSQVDPDAPVSPLATLSRPFSAFLLGPDDPANEVAALNLRALGANHIKLETSVRTALSSKNPDGLANFQYDFILINTNLVVAKHVQEVQQLQPKATVSEIPSDRDLADPR